MTQYQYLLLQRAAAMPPAKARMVVEAILAKEEQKKDSYEDALEAMAVAMEKRMVAELEESFTEA